jgi:hypothetical protein
LLEIADTPYRRIGSYKILAGDRCMRCTLHFQAAKGKIIKGKNHAYPVKLLKSPVKALYPLNDKTHHKANKKRLNNR